LPKLETAFLGGAPAADYLQEKNLADDVIKLLARADKTRDCVIRKVRRYVPRMLHTMSTSHIVMYIGC
jgi:hypothetical protein